MESEARPRSERPRRTIGYTSSRRRGSGPGRRFFHRVSRTFRFQEEGFLEGFTRLVSRSSTDPIAPDPRAEICAARSVRRARRRDFQHSSREGLSRPTGESANRERPRGESFPRAFVSRGVIRTGKQSGTRAETRPTRPPNRVAARRLFMPPPSLFRTARSLFARIRVRRPPRGGAVNPGRAALVSYPRAPARRGEDGGGREAPGRGRAHELRRLRERRRGRGKRRRQGGAAPHHLFRRVARARATAPPFAALAFPRAARVRTPPATDPPLDATRRASPHPARVRRCPAGAGPTETKARSATTPRRDSAARSETTTTRA